MKVALLVHSYFFFIKSNTVLSNTAPQGIMKTQVLNILNWHCKTLIFGGVFLIGAIGGLNKNAKIWDREIQFRIQLYKKQYTDTHR